MRSAQNKATEHTNTFFFVAMNAIERRNKELQERAITKALETMVTTLHLLSMPRRAERLKDLNQSDRKQAVKLLTEYRREMPQRDFGNTVFDIKTFSTTFKWRSAEYQAWLDMAFADFMAGRL